MTQLEGQDVFFQLCPDLLCVSDMEGRLLVVNSAWKNAIGLAAQDLREASLSELVHPNDQIDLMTRFSELASGAKSVKVVNRLRRRDGSYARLSWSFTTDEKRRRVYGVARDLGEGPTHQVLNSIITASPHAIIAVDAKRNIRIWNPAAERMFGWSVDEVLGQKVPFVADRQRSESNKFNLRALGGESFNNHEVQRTRRDGVTVDLLVSAAPTYDQEGDIDGFLTVATDVTEYKSLERQLLRTQRLDSVGALASGVAHDLNNVLAPIRMSLQLLREKIDDPTTQHTLDSLETCVGRGADLIRQILTFAKGAQSERAPVQMRHIIRETKEVVLQTTLKSVVIQSDIPQDLWKVVGEATQLQQIVMNLCLNARDAMPSGGILSVRAENVNVEEGSVTSRLGLSPGPHVLLEVSDNGCGIPAAIQAKVFEPFFTTKAPEKGTGLGLSTVAAIVRSHGGHIGLISELGRGTTFRVYLPALCDAEDTEAPNPPPKPSRGEGECVLVVDDEPIVRDVARLTLEAHGYRVLEARDGAEGVAMYAQHRRDIRVVISDMDMPIMNGAAMIRSLESIDPNVRIICASGLVPSAQLDPTPRRVILPKPYTGGELLQSVRNLMQVA